MKREPPTQDTLQTGTICLAALSGTIIFLCQPSLSSMAQSPPAPHAIGSSHPPYLSERVSQQIGLSATVWEGSAEGKAYSEFNHHMGGALVAIIGLSELHGVWGIAAWSWMRLFLPGEMLVAGGYLAVWSNHAVWPIGSRTFMDTFSQGDTITLQHERAVYPGQQASHAPRSVRNAQQADGRKGSDDQITRLALLPPAHVNHWGATANGRPPSIPLEGMKMAKYEMHDDCRKAIRVLGLPQASPEVAREKAVRWFRTHGYA